MVREHKSTVYRIQVRLRFCALYSIVGTPGGEVFCFRAPVWCARGRG